MLTVNKKLLLRLFIGLVVVGGGLFAIHFFQADRATDALRWQSERAAENGKLDKAIAYMRQYLELRPEDHEAATRLAEMILQKGNGARQLTGALFLYERVLREAPQREDVRRKLLDLSLRLGRFSDAQIHARALLDKSPDESDLWEKLGVCQSAQNKIDDARVSFEKSIAADNHNISAYGRLVDLLVGQMNLVDEGRDLLDKLVKANPRNADAWLTRARFLRGREQMTECQSDLDRALEIEPESADGLLMLAEIVHGKGEASQARAMLLKGLKKHPKDVRYYRLLSWIELGNGNLAAGIDCLEKGMRELPGALELLTPLADLLIQQGEVDKARDLLRRIEGQRGFASQVRYLRGRLLMADGKWNDAVGVLDHLRTEAVAMPGLSAQVSWLLALCHERLGNADAQLEALKRVLAIEPGHLNARLKFGMMHLSAGRFDDAVKEYVVAARSPYAPLGARMTLGRLFIAKARSTGSKNDWAIAGDYIDALRKRYPNTVDPVLLAAEMNLHQRKHDAARKLLRDEAGRKVNDERIWSALAAVELDGSGLHTALEVLDEAQSLIGDRVELRLARARIWSTDWQSGQTQRILAAAKGSESLAEADQLRLLNGLADICGSVGDHEGVKRLQKQIASRLPKDRAIRSVLFANAARTDDAALLDQLRGELQKLQKPGEDVLAVAETLATIDELKPDEARFGQAQDLSRRLLAKWPDRPDVHFLAARLAEKAGENRAASRHYELAAEFDPMNRSYKEGQLAARIRAGEDLKPRFEQMINDPRLSWDAFRALVGSVLAQADDATFDKCMSALTPALNKSGSMLLWAAQLESSRKRDAKALALIERACQVAPSLADAWIARLRLRPADKDDILPKLRSDFDERSFYLIGAESLEALRTVQPDWLPAFSKPGQRRSWTKASMNVHAIRGRVREASDILRNLANDPKAAPDDVAWAKRMSTMLAAAGSNPEDRRAALSALKEWKPGPNSSLDDLRAHVATLAIATRHLYGSERKQVLLQAVESMKLAVAAKGATAKDWYSLSHFQMLVGDRPAQLAALKTAMEKEESNLFYLAAYVDELLNDGNQTEAEPLMDKLQAALHDTRAAATAAKFHCLANNADRVFEVVDSYERGSDPGTPEGFARQRQGAEILDQLARLASSKGLACGKSLLNGALERYRFAIKNFPESTGAMAALLAFDGRVQPAYDLLTQMKPNLPLQALASGAMGVLRNGNSTPKHFELVRGWIDEALVQDPRNLTLRLSMAELLAIQHDYAKAEPIYREVLKGEPDNVIALNNLAWILAPRTEAAEEAMHCVDRAIEISGPTGELLDTRARIHIARGSYDRAIEDLHQALQQGQTSLRWFHLAIAQFKQLKKEESIRSFKEARARGINAQQVHPDDLAIFRVMTSQME